MGRIITENQSSDSIVQMSKSLHDKFLKNEKTDIVKLVFRLKDIPDFIHYFSSNEDIEGLINISDELEFESKFTDISGDPGASVQSFKKYLEGCNLEEKVIVVSD